MDLANKTTFSYFCIWVGARLANFGCLKDLDAIITAIADIQADRRWPAWRSAQGCGRTSASNCQP